jgi:hypothetical protein
VAAGSLAVQQLGAATTLPGAEAVAALAATLPHRPAD